MIQRAHFIASLEGADMIVVIDKGDGKSVTNDIERVVEVIGEYCTIGERQMIYRDSDHVWDGVRIEAGRFAGFVPLRVSKRENAITIARYRIARGMWGKFIEGPK